MPVTKGTKSEDDAEKSEQTQDAKGYSPVEKSPEGKIPEQREAQEIKKERHPQEETDVPVKDIRSPSSEQRESEAEDDTATAQKSETPKEDPSTTKSEDSITSIVTSLEPQQTEGTAGIKSPNLSGDGNNSPDITTSSLSADTLSEQGEELDAQVIQGSDLHCRICKSRFTPGEDNPDSCSDLCPKCELATTSFIPQIPQPMGNPIKNPRDEIPLQPMGQQDEEPQSPVVAVAVGGPGMPPEDNPPPEDIPSPGDEQQQVGQGETTAAPTTTDTTTTATNAPANSDGSIAYYIIKGIVIVFFVAAIVMWTLVLFPELLSGRQSQKTSSKLPSDSPFREALRLQFRNAQRS